LELKHIEKAGAVFSAVGIALLITFVLVLLAFPITKQCQRTIGKCEFYSTAPDPVKFIVNPIFLASALMVIAGGVGTTRFAIWYQYKKQSKNI
jgi:hypothetical protein